MAKLEKEGLLGIQRPIRIVAKAIVTAADSMRVSLDSDNDDDDEIRGKPLTTKIVHFQRHGQGYHNLLGELHREHHGKPVELDDKNVQMNPFLRPEILDSPLTEKGRLQCVEKANEASLLSPQVMLVSPLQRAIQTAELTFGAFKQSIPWVAHEGAREQTGLLQCNKRRSKDVMEEQFPHVDFSALTDNEDVHWDDEARESPAAETERIYEFLTDILMKREEQEIAVVGHSAWLFSMCNAVMECEGEGLTSLFSTAEIRSMRVSFYDNNKACTE